MTNSTRRTTNESTSTNQPLYDLTPLRMLIQNDEKQFKKLLTIFLQTFEQNITALQEAVDNNSAAQVEFTAHKIKGSAGQLRATRVSEIAFDLETMGREARLENAHEGLRALEKSYQNLKPALEAEL